MNTGSIANLSVMDYLKRIREERVIISELEDAWDLSYPEAAKLLLGRLRSSGLFKTHVGRCFITSLERRVASDKQDNRLIMMIIMLPVTAVLLCAGIVVMPVLFSRSSLANVAHVSAIVSPVTESGSASSSQTYFLEVPVYTNDAG